jgi:tetratricopeptide (TPR) repeat protein
MLAYARDYDAALPLAQKPIDLDPHFPEAYHISGYVLMGKGDFAGAAGYLEKSVALSGRAAWPVAKLARPHSLELPADHRADVDVGVQHGNEIAGPEGFDALVVAMDGEEPAAGHDAV